MKIQSFPDLMQFVLLHYEKARDWNPVKTFEWLWFHQGQGHILMVEDNKKEVVGFAVIHPVMKADDGADAFDPEGPCLYIDLAVSLTKGALQALGFAALNRFGVRPTVAWMRDGIIHEFPITTVRRNLFRNVQPLIQLETRG